VPVHFRYQVTPPVVVCGHAQEYAVRARRASGTEAPETPTGNRRNGVGPGGEDCLIVLLTISTTHEPATDLGYLLHKHPGRVQSFTESVGTAHVFYPESTENRCTVALLLEVDPIGLVRGRKGPAGDGFALGQYVNDRPYAASSMLAMALKDVFRTALTGVCAARPDLAASAIPLDVHVPAVPCRGGADLLRRLFEPMGWTVAATSSPLDPTIPEWGDSRYLDVRLTGDIRLADALNHLYVLLPVLDDAKHYWVSNDEVDKLIRAGGGWLSTHPEQALIVRRYLSHRRELAQSALARLAEVDDAEVGQFDNAVEGALDLDSPDRPVPLAEQRRGAVLAAVRASGARTVGDFGCGEGVLVRDLLAERGIERIVAVDVSARALQIAGRKLRLDKMAEQQRQRLQIFQSALTYRDDRLAGLDAAVLMEVVEHVDPPRLDALERTVFGHAAPATVIMTTPNAEHNVRFETLPAETMRHRDHRFEWTRAQFQAWADTVAASYGYAVRYLPVGTDDPEVGPPTQMAVFSQAVAT
jgi:3' terminal RNA ribose 2'-O-methyltransferase Hen1